MSESYFDDPMELWWDIFGLMVAHYGTNPKSFDLRCLEIADKVRRAGDTQRALWIDHMVETHKVPSREWEDELWASMAGGDADGE